MLAADLYSWRVFAEVIERVRTHPLSTTDWTTALGLDDVVQTLETSLSKIRPNPLESRMRPNRAPRPEPRGACGRNPMRGRPEPREENGRTNDHRSPLSIWRRVESDGRTDIGHTYIDTGNRGEHRVGIIKSATHNYPGYRRLAIQTTRS